MISSRWIWTGAHYSIQSIHSIMVISSGTYYSNTPAAVLAGLRRVSHACRRSPPSEHACSRERGPGNRRSCLHARSCHLGMAAYILATGFGPARVTCTVCTVQLQQHDWIAAASDRDAYTAGCNDDAISRQPLPREPESS